MRTLKRKTNQTKKERKKEGKYRSNNCDKRERAIDASKYVSSRDTIVARPCSDVTCQWRNRNEESKIDCFAH